MAVGVPQKSKGFSNEGTQMAMELVDSSMDGTGSDNDTLTCWEGLRLKLWREGRSESYGL
jgi:hypothetical protein